MSDIEENKENRKEMPIKTAESSRTQNAWIRIFLITAIFAVTTPIILIMIFVDDISNAFVTLGQDEDSTYWVLGTVLVILIFSIVALHMVYNKKKRNLTLFSKIAAIFWMPILILATFGGGAYYLVDNGLIFPEITKTRLDRGPYLSWKEDPMTTMTITFERKTSGSYSVQYIPLQSGQEATDPSIDWNSAVNKPFVIANSGLKRDYDGYYHYSITLYDLNPDSKYAYKIPGFMNKPVSFKTAPAVKNGTVKLLIYGDSREKDKVFDNQHIQLVNQIFKEQNVSDFSCVINTGDISYKHDYINGWNLHFDAIQHLADRIPYMVASGNHEWNTAEGFNLKNQPALDIQEFPTITNTSTPVPAVSSLDEISFAFGLGDIYMIFIGQPHAGSNNATYLDWLKTQLEIGNGTIGAGYDFTFVFDHYPPFDLRETESNDNVNMIHNEVPLFHSSSVEAVISGHNHVLAHQNITWSGDPDYPNSRNITYLISGGGGASIRVPRYDVWNDRYGEGLYGRTVYAKSVYHYYTVEVDGLTNTATFTCYELGKGKSSEASFTINAAI